MSTDNPMDLIAMIVASAQAVRYQPTYGREKIDRRDGSKRFRGKQFKERMRSKAARKARKINRK